MLFIKCTMKIVYGATMTEVQMKNLSRMHIHPNRMGAIRDREVKQLFLNAKPFKVLSLDF